MPNDANQSEYRTIKGVNCIKGVINSNKRDENM